MKKCILFCLAYMTFININGQKLKTITKYDFITTEKFEVLKKNKKIRNGSYLMKWKSDGTVLVKGQYQDNRKIGVWEYSDFRTKKLEQKYDYDTKSITFSEYSFWDKTPYSHFKYNGEWIMGEIDTLPEVIGGLSGLKLKLTKFALKITDFPKAGITIFSFIVTKEGKTRDYKVVSTPESSGVDDILQVIMEDKDNWTAAIYKGTKVDSEVFLQMNVKYQENSINIRSYTIDFYNLFGK